MSFNPSFEGLVKSTGLRITPKDMAKEDSSKKETKVTTRNEPRPVPSPRGHA